MMDRRAPGRGRGCVGRGGEAERGRNKGAKAAVLGARGEGSVAGFVVEIAVELGWSALTVCCAVVDISSPSGCVDGGVGRTTGVISLTALDPPLTTSTATASLPTPSFSITAGSGSGIGGSRTDGVASERSAAAPASIGERSFGCCFPPSASISNRRLGWSSMFSSVGVARGRRPASVARACSRWV